MQLNVESKYLSAVPASQSIAIAQRARDLKAAGQDIVSIAIGEPDFLTPNHVIDAAATAAHQGHTRYTPVAGTPELRQAVSDKFYRDNQLTYNANSEILIGTGAKQLIYSALQATLNNNDEVIICTPYWVSYPTITKLAGANPRFIQTKPEHHFVPTAEQLQDTITTKTRWLILNYPNNPSGSIATVSQYEKIAQVLRRHPHILILSDEIYEHICYDGAQAPSFAATDSTMKNRTLTVNGVSKAYGMTGWRIGFAAGPKEIIASMTKLQSHITGGTSAVSQAAALAALTMDQSILKARQEIYQYRRDLVLTQLSACHSLELIRPQGAFYVFAKPKSQNYPNSTTPAEHLLNHGVAVAPGDAFGMPGWFRISIATNDKELKFGTTHCRRKSSRCRRNHWI